MHKIKNIHGQLVSLNFVDITQFGLSDLGDQAKDYVGLSDVNALLALSRAYIARYLGGGFTADITGAVNSIETIPSGDVADKSYYSEDLGLRYDLNKLIGETAWFDPYAKFSISPFWVDNEAAIALSPSFGFNTWFTEEIGLNFETAYIGDTLYIQNYHFQHAVSLVIRFGAKDSDKDGVTDNIDEYVASQN